MEISGSFQPVCARDTSSVTRCWGANNGGQLGTGEIGATGANSASCFGSTPCYVTPQQTSTVRPIQLAAGFSSTLALDADGNVASWGQNPFGQLGRPPLSSQQNCDGNGTPCTATPQGVVGLP